MSNKSESQQDDKASDSFIDSFVRAIHNYFNPLLCTIEEIQRDAKKKHKK